LFLNLWNVGKILLYYGATTQKTTTFIFPSNFMHGHATNAFDAEARLNNIWEFSSYRKENTTLHRYKDQLLNAV
jgi:hypothetical protein